MPESIRRQLGPSRADTGAGTRAAWLTLRRRHLRHRVDPRGGRPRLAVFLFTATSTTVTIYERDELGLPHALVYARQSRQTAASIGPGTR